MNKKAVPGAETTSNPKKSISRTWYLLPFWMAVLCFLTLVSEAL